MNIKIAPGSFGPPLVKVDLPEFLSPKTKKAWLTPSRILMKVSSQRFLYMLKLLRVKM